MSQFSPFNRAAPILPHNLAQMRAAQSGGVLQSEPQSPRTGLLSDNPDGAWPTGFVFGGKFVPQGYWAGNQFQLPPVPAAAPWSPSTPVTAPIADAAPSAPPGPALDTGDNRSGADSGAPVASDGPYGDAPYGDGGRIGNFLTYPSLLASRSAGDIAGLLGGALGKANGASMLGPLSGAIGPFGAALGPFGAALGTGLDVYTMNNLLAGMGMGRPAEWGPAMLAGALNPFGVFGENGWLPGGASVNQQGADRMGMDLSAFHDLLTPVAGTELFAGKGPLTVEQQIALMQGQPAGAAALTPEQQAAWDNFNFNQQFNQDLTLNPEVGTPGFYAATGQNRDGETPAAGAGGGNPGAEGLSAEQAAANADAFSAGAGNMSGDYDNSYGGDYSGPSESGSADESGAAGSDESGDSGDPGSDGWARGGAVRGPGTTTSDSIAAQLSNQEHVVKAADIRALGRGSYARGHHKLRQLIRHAVAQSSHAAASHAGAGQAPGRDAAAPHAAVRLAAVQPAAVRLAAVQRETR